MEPGQSPSAPVELYYNHCSEIQNSCSQFRLYGGMHFSTAIPAAAGVDLCTGVASLIVDRANLLKDGDDTGALADLEDTSIEVKVRKVLQSKFFKSPKTPKKSKKGGKMRRNLRTTFGHECLVVVHQRCSSSVIHVYTFTLINYCQ